MLKAFKGAIRKVTLPPLIRWLGRRGFLVLPGKDDHYSQDGLSTIHNHDFLREASFLDAYRKGVEASQGVEQPIHWRLHVALWAASVASRLEGDFVECGVNQGFISSAVMQYLDWDHLGRRFFLLDTFSGPVEDYYSDEEMEAGRVDESRSARARGSYNLDVEVARHSFSQWSGVRIVVGPVPDTLPQVETDRVAYLHLDMNCAWPETKAAEFFWPRMADGGLILLDDYAYRGYEHQKKAMDDFAESNQVAVLSLPTGQGLIIKPPDGK